MEKHTNKPKSPYHFKYFLIKNKADYISALADWATSEEGRNDKLVYYPDSFRDEIDGSCISEYKLQEMALLRYNIVIKIEDYLKYLKSISFVTLLENY